MKKQRIVRLSKQERNTLRELIKKLKSGNERVGQAQIFIEGGRGRPC